MDLNRDFVWNHARAFLATAEAGSLSAAARRMGLTQPTLGRQVSALENALGVVLFERVGNTLHLTPAGGTLARHVKAMQTAAAQVSLSAEGHSEAMEGRVAITASDIFSVYLLPDALHALRAAAPRLVIDIVAANDLRDIQRREADIAIRHVRPEEPDLIGRKLADGRAHLYGSPAYLDARGRPVTATDLATHDIIGFENPAEFIAYMADLDVLLRPAQFPLVSANGLVCWELVKRGFGLSVMDDAVAARTDGVERVLPDLEIRFPIWLTTHRELQKSARIRLVYDHLARVVSTFFR